MKSILSNLNDIITKLEDNGNIKEAENLNNLFIKMASEDDWLFDPRQKGSDLDSAYPHEDEVHEPQDESDEHALFDPRQKDSRLDDYLAQEEHHVEPMKYQKKIKVKVKRIK